MTTTQKPLERGRRVCHHTGALTWKRTILSFNKDKPHEDYCCDCGRPVAVCDAGEFPKRGERRQPIPLEQPVDDMPEFPPAGGGKRLERTKRK